VAQTSPPRAEPRRAKAKRKPRPRAALPREFAETSLADQEQMLGEIFGVILEFSKKSGISPDRAARLFAHARRTAGTRSYRRSDALHMRVMARIGEALKTWYTDPEYLDARGVPASLPLSGARSVETLITRFLPKVNARETARWLMAEGVLREQTSGCVVPVRRVISFIRPNAMVLDRIPFLMQALLSTYSHNIEAKATGEETRCERMLTLDQFPVSQVPRFSWEVKRLVPMLLDSLESWAAPHLRAAERKSQKTARVGVEVFSYVEEPAPRAKVRRRL
jgi:hypothetical protein